MTDYRDTSYDGAPAQAGMTMPALTGCDPSFNMLGFREMIVIAVHPVDDPDNQTKCQAEYDCRDLQTGDIFPFCRRLSGMSSKDSGDDDVLHSASTLRASAKGPLSRQTPALDTDGDRVLVGFVEGSRSRPYIVGVFRHEDAKYGATRADGERRLLIHAGTRREYKADGSFFMHVAKDGNVEVVGAYGVNVSKGATIVATDTLTVDGSTIKLGQSAVQSGIRAEDFNSAVLAPINAAGSALISAAGAALSTISPDVGTGVPTVATITAVVETLTAMIAFATAVVASTSAFPSAVSAKVKLE